MLPKRNRISDHRCFEVLSKKGVEYKSLSLVFRFLKKSNPPSEFAVRVSARLAKKAVIRNRLRRQILEAVRLHLPLLKKSVLALAIPRPKALTLSFEDLSREVAQFFNHLNTDAK